MTVGQTTYPTKPAVSFNGMLADLVDHDMTSKVNLDPGGAIPFGVAVKNGADDTTAVLPTAGNDKICGIAVHSHAYDNAALANSLGVPAGDMINNLKRGRVWVNVEEAVAVNGAVRVRTSANGGNTQLGAFRTTADAGHSGLLPNARFKSATTGAGLAIVEIDLIGQDGLMTAD